MVSDKIYSQTKPVSILADKLGIGSRRHKIPRGMSKRNRQFMYKLQAENRKFAKERKTILSKYKVGNYNDHDKDGYSKKPVFLYEGVYYS